MTPDGFDDVGYEVVESPEPPRPAGRRGRRMLATTAVVVGVGAIVAGGALAVTGTGSTHPARNRAAAQPPVTFTADGVPTTHSGRPCLAGRGAARHHRTNQHRERTTPRY